MPLMSLKMGSLRLPKSSGLLDIPNPHFSFSTPGFNGSKFTCYSVHIHCQLVQYTCRQSTFFMLWNCLSAIVMCSYFFMGWDFALCQHYQHFSIGIVTKPSLSNIYEYLPISLLYTRSHHYHHLLKTHLVSSNSRI